MNISGTKRPYEEDSKSGSKKGSDEDIDDAKRFCKSNENEIKLSTSSIEQPDTFVSIISSKTKRTSNFYLVENKIRRINGMR